MNGHSFKKLFEYAVKTGVSDIHLSTGEPPAFRIHGELINVKANPLAPQDIIDLCKILFGNRPAPAIDSILEYDGSLDIPGLCRFRYNIFRYDSKLAVVMRIIPQHIPTIAELGLPTVIKTIAETERGLVLITGATGMGKSTTVAAMIDHLNSKRRCHIVTIEDPVEFVYPRKHSRVTQREIGRDTESFAAALRSALRQDPDVILVGEMRDAETMDIALKAAETGHTVFSTIHTTDSSKTIGRLLSMFPPEEQKEVRLRLADSLKATVSQRLLKRADKKGLIAAQEIMLSNKAVEECIVNPERTAELKSFIEKGYNSSGTGSQTFEQHLTELYLQNIVTLDEAKSASANPSDFESNLKFVRTQFDQPKKRIGAGRDDLLRFTESEVTLDQPKEPDSQEEARILPLKFGGRSR